MHVYALINTFVSIQFLITLLHSAQHLTTKRLPYDVLPQDVWRNVFAGNVPSALIHYERYYTATRNNTDSFIRNTIDSVEQALIAEMKSLSLDGVTRLNDLLWSSDKTVSARRASRDHSAELRETLYQRTRDIITIECFPKLFQWFPKLFVNHTANAKYITLFTDVFVDLLTRSPPRAADVTRRCYTGKINLLLFVIDRRLVDERLRAAALNATKYVIEPNPFWDDYYLGSLAMDYISRVYYLLFPKQHRDQNSDYRELFERTVTSAIIASYSKKQIGAENLLYYRAVKRLYMNPSGDQAYVLECLAEIDMPNILKFISSLIEQYHEVITDSFYLQKYGDYFDAQFMAVLSLQGTRSIDANTLFGINHMLLIKDRQLVSPSLRQRALQFTESFIQLAIQSHDDQAIRGLVRQVIHMYKELYHWHSYGKRNDDFQTLVTRILVQVITGNPRIFTAGNCMALNKVFIRWSPKEHDPRLMALVAQRTQILTEETTAAN